MRDGAHDIAVIHPRVWLTYLHDLGSHLFKGGEGGREGGRERIRDRDNDRKRERERETQRQRDRGTGGQGARERERGREGEKKQQIRKNNSRNTINTYNELIQIPNMMNIHQIKPHTA